MKVILFVCLLLSVHLLRAQGSSAVVVSPTVAASASFTAMSADEKAVIETEKQRFAAQVSKNYAVLDQVLANDLVYTHSNGGADTKQSYIQALRDGRTTYDAISVEEQKARVYGNTAVINGLCLFKATNKGEIINSHLRYITVYVRTGSQWQMVAWQSMKLAQ